MNRRQGSERCPACAGRMFPGDVVCRACERRVKAVRPDLIGDYANRELTDVRAADLMRERIVGAAKWHAPKGAKADARRNAGGQQS